MCVGECVCARNRVLEMSPCESSLRAMNIHRNDEELVGKKRGESVCVYVFSS